MISVCAVPNGSGIGLVDDIRLSTDLRYPLGSPIDWTENFEPPRRHERDASTFALYRCDEAPSVIP